MKRLLNTTTALSVALSTFTPLPVLAQSEIMVDGQAVICLPSKEAVCPEGAFCVVAKVEANCERNAVKALAAIAKKAVTDEAAKATQDGADAAADTSTQADADAAAAAAAAKAEADAAAAAQAEADKAAAAQAEAEAAAAAAQAEAEKAAAEQAEKDAAAAAQAEAEAAAAAAQAEAEAAAAAQAQADAAAAAQAEADAAAAAAATEAAAAQADADVAAAAKAEADAAVAAQVEADAAAAAQADADAAAAQADADAAAAQADADAAAAQADADAGAKAEADAAAAAQAAADAAAAQAATDAAAMTEAEAEAAAAAQAEADAAAAAQAMTEAEAAAKADADAAAAAQAEAETAVVPETVPVMTEEEAAAAAAEDAAAAAAQADADAAAAQAAADAAAAAGEAVPEPVEAPVVTQEEVKSLTDILVVTPAAEPAPVGAAAELKTEAAVGEGKRPSDVAPSPEAQVETRTVTKSDARKSDQEFDAAPVVVSEGKKSGLSNLEKAGLVVLGALIVGAILNDGQEVVSNTGDRVVIRQPDGTYVVYKDDDTLLREPGSTVRTETFSDGSTRTIVEREDGTQVVTIRDASGRVLRRATYDAQGREIVLIDDLEPERPIDVTTLPRPVKDRVVLSTSDQDAALKARLAALEAQDLGRSFSLRQVREIREVRDLAATIDLDTITFDSGSSAIRVTEAEKLADLGRLITDMIADNPGEMFLIEGHTDAVGSASSNLALSDRRAESVALALTEYFDVPPENLVVQGYGEAELRIDTQGDERLNRRVAARIITPLLRSASN